MAVEPISAWRQVKAVMATAGIPAGPHRTPKGLRYGFGVHTISSGVPLNMLSKWMGHATLEITTMSPTRSAPRSKTSQLGCGVSSPLA